MAALSCGVVPRRRGVESAGLVHQLVELTEVRRPPVVRVDEDEAKALGALIDVRHPGAVARTSQPARSPRPGPSTMRPVRPLGAAARRGPSGEPLLIVLVRFDPRRTSVRLAGSLHEERGETLG